tara:strand:- start:223 stop:690 length:468 start_codon:yes stop_codon:yes gene_type:complete
MAREYRKSLDLRVAKQIRKELDSFIPSIKEKTGLKVDLGNATYTDSEITFKITLRLVNAPSKEMEELIRENETRNRYDFMVVFDLKKTVKQGVRLFQLTGFKPRARKKPYIITDQHKNSYIISEEQAERMFGIPETKKEGKLILTDPPKQLGVSK